MNIITTEKQQIVKVESYIADDGKEFTNKSDCVWYEETLEKRLLEQKIGSIEKLSSEPPFVDSEHCWNWYFVKNQDDVNVICDYYNTLSEYNNDLGFSEITFPRWICVEVGYDKDAWAWGTIDDYKNQVDKFLEQFNK